MPLEKPTDGNESSDVPDGEIPLVLDFKHYDHQECDNISSTKLHNKIIELCKVPMKFKSNGGIAVICDAVQCNLCTQIKDTIKKHDPEILREEMFIEDAVFSSINKVRGCEASVVIFHNFHSAVNPLEVITRSRNRIVFIVNKSSNINKLLRAAEKEDLVSRLVMVDENNDLLCDRKAKLKNTTVRKSQKNAKKLKYQN